MKKIFFSLACSFLLNANTHAQEYFVRNNSKDTIRCSNMEYTTSSQGFIVELTYTDKAGKPVKLEGKKKLKDINTLNYTTGIVERMPLKISKPDAYVRYGERVINGKLKVLVYNDQYQTTNWVKSPIDSRMDGYKTSTSGTYMLYLKMPDGTFLNANKKKVVKKIIKPYLLKCKEFEENYKGKFTNEEKQFMDMIRIYNSVCK
jgi:hypothetical protein